MKNMNRVHDLTGQRFGNLTVIGLDDKKQTRRTFWICECDCGNITSSRSDGLLSGAKKSCGCRKARVSAENVSKNHKHKQSGTRLYCIWQGMKARCYNPHDTRFDRYGGRGIKVCDEWKADFQNFFLWALENGYSETLQIDRIDNDGDYCPDNCKWSTHQEQSRNRSTNVNITIGNSTKSLTEWCEIFQLDFKMIYSRYQRNGFESIDELFNKKKENTGVIRNTA